MKTRKKLKRIAVAAKADMTRREARITNGVMNTLVGRHHMCVACAIGAAVTMVKSDRPEHEHKPVTTKFCSNACAQAMSEFYEETVGVRGELVSADDLPPTMH